MRFSMKNKELLNLWKEEEKRVLKGWDFSLLNGRIEEEDLPWDYKSIVNQYRNNDKVLLDMGTGGGGFLLTLKHPYKKTYVTESYKPNIDLCHDTLSPLGIHVNGFTSDDNLPFRDDFFDLVINRHESYEISEVLRILKPGGCFITQQVGCMNNLDLSRIILNKPDREPTFQNCLDIDLNKLLKYNFRIIEKKEVYPYLRFFDIGALVYFAKIIEWEFPEFSVTRCQSQLENLNNIIKDKGYIESKEHRYFLIAQKK